MSESELGELKSVLRSLVVSSPTKVDVRSILKDYRSLIGSPLPYAKFGYRDAVEFFKERCGDCFLTQGPASNPVLTLIVPDTLKHIDKFVKAQKATPNTKLKGKRTSIPEPFGRRQNNENLIVKTFINQTEQRGKNAATTVTKTPHNIDRLNITYRTRRESENRAQTSNYKEETNNTSNNVERGENGHLSAEDSSIALQAFLKKRLPQYRSQNMDNGTSSSHKSPDDGDSGRGTLSGHKNTRRAQEEELKREIHEVVRAAPTGIWCMELMKLYRERYKRELNFTRFGYMSIVSLVKSMPEVVRVTRPRDNGDWRLADVGAGGPGADVGADVGAAPPARRAQRRHARPDPGDALPGIDFDLDVFPADCLHFLESIPPADLTDVRPGAMIEVNVGEVYSPSHFWLMRLGDDYNLAMEHIMDEMTAYFKSAEGRERRLARGAVRVGQYCASLYDGDWHRSLIVSLLDADHVKVRHVDYGTVDAVGVGSLRPLLRLWARLPAQALRARLAALRPAAGTQRWTHSASVHFLGLVKDRRLVANVVALDPAEEWFETFLVDTSGADDVCLSQEMIAAGHADPRPDSVLAAEEAYLYPRFEALEDGATPNLGDIDRYLRAGLALEYVEAYRRHVPAAIPAPASPASASPPSGSPAPRSPAPGSPPPGSPAPGSPPPSERALSPAPALQTQIPLLLPTASDPPVPPPPTPPPPPPPAAPPAPPPAAPPAPRPVLAPPGRFPAPPSVRPPAREAGSVQLSATECQIYQMLCAMDPIAAQCYMSAALQRAHRTPQPPFHPPQPSFHPPQPSFQPPQPSFQPPQPSFQPPQPSFHPPQPSFQRPPLPPPQFGPSQFGPPHFGPPPFGPAPFGPSSFGPPPFHPLPFGPPPGF